MSKYNVHFPDSISIPKINNLYYDMVFDNILELAPDTDGLWKLSYSINYAGGNIVYNIRLDRESYIITLGGKTYWYNDFPTLTMKTENEKNEQVLDEL